MSDGTPLREVLSICGIHGLTERQIRALYRNRAFQAMYKEARQKWLAEWGASLGRSRHRRPTARPKGCRGPDCLGMSREFLRKL